MVIIVDIDVVTTFYESSTDVLSHTAASLYDAHTASWRVLVLVSLHTICNNIWDFVGSETIQHKQTSQTHAYFSPSVMYGYDIVH